MRVLPKSLTLLLVLCCLLPGCAPSPSGGTAGPVPQRFSTTYIGHMDTVVNLTAYCVTSGEFDDAPRRRSLSWSGRTSFMMPMRRTAPCPGSTLPGESGSLYRRS